REAPTQNPGERLPYVAIGGFRILVQQRRRGQDDARQTEPALGGLLVDECFLQRMRPLRAAESLERRDRGAVQRAHWRDARTNGALPDQDPGPPALSEAAATCRSA